VAAIDEEMHHNREESNAEMPSAKTINKKRAGCN
jgi:hypothetical protein